jgi:hypothetical protein
MVSPHRVIHTFEAIVNIAEAISERVALIYIHSSSA